MGGNISMVIHSMENAQLSVVHSKFCKEVSTSSVDMEEMNWGILKARLII